MKIGPLNPVLILFLIESLFTAVCCPEMLGALVVFSLPARIMFWIVTEKPTRRAAFASWAFSEFIMAVKERK